MSQMKQMVSAAADVAILKHLIKVLSGSTELSPAMLTAINHRLKGDFGSELGESTNVAEMYKALKLATYEGEKDVVKDMTTHIDTIGKMPPLEDTEDPYEHKA